MLLKHSNLKNKSLLPLIKNLIENHDKLSIKEGSLRKIASDIISDLSLNDSVSSKQTTLSDLLKASHLSFKSMFQSFSYLFDFGQLNNLTTSENLNKMIQINLC
jgi:CRISPR/Cas system CMR subunit Cmr6 (Cas7 group RAMP superfamily)